MRLLITAGAWGAGLCLVVGLVALEAGGSGQVANLASAHDRDGLVRSTTTNATRARHIFSGIGNQNIGPFWVGPHSRWKLDWSYRCTAAGSAGHLSIREKGHAVSVIASGQSGRGQTWTDGGPGQRSLVIRSNCTWTVGVAGPQ